MAAFQAQMISAQESAAPPFATRIEMLEAQQKEKTARLTPARAGKAEQFFNKHIGENPLQKVFGGIPGLHLRFGGLPTGSGFGLGMEYHRPDLAKGSMSFRTFALGSNKLWYALGAELQFPRLANDHIHIGFNGGYVNGDSFDYYGPGPDSKKSGRTNYLREEAAFGFSFSVKPARRYLKLGADVGYSLMNVGPGRASLFASADQAYSPAVTPGIDGQPNYFRAGPFLEIDSRDSPKDPHSGTHLLAKLDIFEDQDYDLFSFKQAEGTIEQYIPFLNKKRVIALRARTVLSYSDQGNVVPFYLQPSLGGASDLRGYRRYRFFDNNMFLMNCEYRWEVFTLLDMALFADAGNVFRRDGDFSLKKLESDAGFGIRFKSRNAVVFRVDTAFSQEGFGLWFNFDHIF
jgi:outer membrane protein assembly factor BamA